MVCENQMDSYFHFQNGKAQNPQTHWRSEDMGAPLTYPVPPPSGTLPAPPADSDECRSTKIEGVLPGYVYIHTLLPNTEFFYHYAYAGDCKHNEYFIPDLLTEEGPSTG
jgi:hypothetical protein